MIRRFGLWWVPVLLLALPLVGLMPARRDLGEYFVPIRRHTAAELGLGRAPWRNPWNGCGEPWFANPQTGVLYPPAWLWRVAPPRWALTGEIALHLAWLSLGAGLLVRRLGGGSEAGLVAEVMAWSAVPVLAVVDVMNNLETLAWLPWIAVATTVRCRWRPAAVAAVVAAGWLAAEPQLWALGLGAVLVWRRRDPRTWAGVGLGVGLAAVQLLPFAWWVAGGDRGPGAAAGALLAGAVPPAGWLGLVVPGLAAGTYLAGLYLGAPLLAAAGVGLRRRPALAAGALAAAVMATLPAAGGGSLYLLLTASLVRYPARFALLAAALAVLAAGLGWREWVGGGGRGGTAAAGGAALVAALLAGPPAGRATAALTGGLLLLAARRPDLPALRRASWVVAVAAALGTGLPLLEPAPERVVVAPAAWPEAVVAGRLYTPPPVGPAAGRLAEDRVARRAWPVGYANLPGIAAVRTDAPVQDRDLATHLAAADRGPEGRWWVDALGSRWLVLTHPPRSPALVPRAQRHGLWLCENRRVMPRVAVVTAPPAAGRRPVPVPDLLAVERGTAGLVVRSSGGGGGVLVVATPPDPGWRWEVDGVPVTPVPGPGALQSVPLPRGWREVRGAYRPPGIVAGAAASVGSLLALAAAAVARRRCG